MFIIPSKKGSKKGKDKKDLAKPTCALAKTNKTYKGKQKISYGEHHVNTRMTCSLQIGTGK